MKHLKKFNEGVISEEEYERLYGFGGIRTAEPFNNTDKDVLSKLLSEYNVSSNIDNCHCRVYIYHDVGTGVIADSIEICKYEDEWYVVSERWSRGKFKLADISYYECDQLEELVKYIKRLDLPKPEEPVITKVAAKTYNGVQGVVSRIINRIRKFNESNGEYYSQITTEEWQKLIGIDDKREYGSNMDEFTEIDKNNIQNWWKELTNSDIRDSLRMDSHDPRHFNNISHINFTITRPFGIFYFTKCKDEWYAVWQTANSRSGEPIKYKCDQLIGLKKFIDEVVLNPFYKI